jgi:hypothetical protein
MGFLLAGVEAAPVYHRGSVLDGYPLHVVDYVDLYRRVPVVEPQTKFFLHGCKQRREIVRFVRAE